MNEVLLIRRDDPLKFNPLEVAVLEDIAPPIWHGPHVGKRLAEAMRTLRGLPMGGVGGYGGSWPPYAYEFEDMLAQAEQGELEKTQRLQNRVRLLPSYADVTRMEAAICWPAQYLARTSWLLVAVNAVAFARSIERDASWVANRRGGFAETWRDRHDRGCEIIAAGLRDELAPVF